MTCPHHEGVCSMEFVFLGLGIVFYVAFVTCICALDRASRRLCPRPPARELPVDETNETDAPPMVEGVLIENLDGSLSAGIPSRGSPRPWVVVATEKNM